MYPLIQENSQIGIISALPADVPRLSVMSHAHNDDGCHRCGYKSNWWAALAKSSWLWEELISYLVLQPAGRCEKWMDYVTEKEEGFIADQ